MELLLLVAIFGRWRRVGFQNLENVTDIIIITHQVAWSLFDVATLTCLKRCEISSKLQNETLWATAEALFKEWRLIT